MVSEKLSQEELAVLVERRETGCSQNENNTGTVVQGITKDYHPVFIPKVTNSAGFVGNYAFRDSGYAGTNSWMCNSPNVPEDPVDYIIQYHVPNALANETRLRISGTNSFGSCYIKDPTASRVFTDGDIWACVGYWKVWWCTVGNAVSPSAYDSLVWVQ